MRPGIGSIALVATVSVYAAAFAHEAPSGQDYTKFRQPNGTSCCNGHDCRPVDFRLHPDGTVTMFPEGQTVVVPRQLLNEQPSDDGLAHWCGIVMPGGGIRTFCAILPRQTSFRSIPDSLVMPAAHHH